ncbi:MAG: hypothetical protein ACLRMZ_03190 [Blautia marasmi]
MSLDESSPPIRMALHLQKRLTNGERLQKYQGGEFLYRFLCALLRETEHPAAQKKLCCAEGSGNYGGGIPKTHRDRGAGSQTGSIPGASVTGV